MTTFKGEIMRHSFKDLTIELYTDNLNRHHVRLDNYTDGQYLNLLTTNSKIQAAMLYQDMYDLLKKYEEKE